MGPYNNQINYYFDCFSSRQSLVLAHFFRFGPF